MPTSPTASSDDSLPLSGHGLVTGGAGFIGSALVRFLLQSVPDVRVTTLDALTYSGNLDNLADVASHPRHRFVHGNITDRDLVRSLMGDVDWVINVAAETHVDRSITGPDIFIQSNIVGTQTLLEAARQAGVQRFVQVSTDEVYGSLGPDGKFTEQSPLQPSSPYSASKASADLIALSYVHTYGLPVCITRCSNNYGPYQYPEKLIPLFIHKASRSESLPVYGDGMNVRDWIHVDDHAAGIATVLAKGVPGEVYHLGAECEWTNLDLIRELLRLLGQPESLITYVTDRPGHDRRYALDCSKTRNTLGWAPRIPFAQGLADTVAWYQANTAWVEGILARQAQQTAALVGAA